MSSTALLLIGIFGASWALQMHQGCDIMVRDEMSLPRGVNTVHPLCNSGSLLWRQPYGAMSVTFSAIPSNGKEQRVCFHVKSRSVRARLEREPPWAPPTSLHNITSLRSWNSPEFCVRKEDRIFIEAEQQHASLVSGVLQLEYVVEDWKKEGEEADTDCGPCSDEKIAGSVCQSLYVFTGKIERISMDPTTGFSELHIAPKRVIQAPTVMTSRRVRRHSKRRHLVLYVPSECGAKHGSELHLFTAKLRLGRLVPVCAPLLAEFTAVWRSVVERNENQCFINL